MTGKGLWAYGNAPTKEKHRKWRKVKWVEREIQSVDVRSSYVDVMVSTWSLMSFWHMYARKIISNLNSATALPYSLTTINEQR